MPLPADPLTPQEAAAKLGVNVASLYRWIRSGRVKAYQVAGSRYLLSAADVERVVKEVTPRD